MAANLSKAVSGAVTLGALSLGAGLAYYTGGKDLFNTQKETQPQAPTSTSRKPEELATTLDLWLNNLLLGDLGA